MSTVLEQHPSVAAPAAPAAITPEQQAHRLGIVRNLTAAMMLGQLYDLRDDVARIFDALARMLGDSRHLRISLAHASALAGNTAPARELLASDLDDWPGAELARVSIALALKVGGDPEWTQVVERVLAVSTDDQARRFAQQVLDTPLHPSSSAP